MSRSRADELERARDPREKRLVARRGTWVASLAAAMMHSPATALRVPSSLVLAAAAVSGAGCITQEIQFQAPDNWPPSVANAAGTSYPLEEIVRLRADQLTGGDGGSITGLRFDVEVRDPDVDQQLFYKVFVDYQEGVGAGPILTDLVPPEPLTTEDRGRRALSFTVPIASVRAAACHRIELLVSSRFERAGSDTAGRDPVEDGDLGTATWWVATQATEAERVDMATCP